MRVFQIRAVQSVRLSGARLMIEWAEPMIERAVTIQKQTITDQIKLKEMREYK